jgi:hypothetical protein
LAIAKRPRAPLGAQGRDRRSGIFGDFFGDTTVKALWPAKRRVRVCPGALLHLEGAAAMSAREESAWLCVEARSAQHCLHRRSGGAQGGGEKIECRRWACNGEKRF